MNKTQLIDHVAGQTGTTKAAATVAVDAVFDGITKTLEKGDRVSVAGFGSFEVRQRAARTGRNPQTGEPIEIKAARIPAFKAGKGLKDAVN